MTDTVAEKPAVRILTVEEILAADDLVEEVLSIAEWGGSVRVRGLTKGQVERLTQAASKSIIHPRTQQITRQVDSQKLNDLMFSESVVEPKFSPEQVKQLAEKAAGPYLKIMQVVTRISGFSQGAEEGEDAFQK